MTDTVEKTAAATVDLQTKAVELIDQLTAGLKAVAPQMADVTLAAVRLQGIVDLVWAVTQICVGLGLICAVYRLARWSLPKIGEAEKYEVITVTSGMFGVASLIVTIMNLGALFSAPMWAAIIDPRLALALRVINKLM